MVTYTNQKPTELVPQFIDHLKQPFDPIPQLKNIAINPLWNPLITGQDVTLTIDNNPVSQDDLTNILLACCADHIDPNAEEIMQEIYRQGLLYYPAKGTTLNMRMLFAIQAAAKVNYMAKKQILPEPNQTTAVYCAEYDICPVCKQFLTGQGDVDTLFVSFAFWQKPEALGIYFINEIAFDKFKTWFKNETATLSAVLDQTTINLCNDFQNIKLQGLTESLLLRKTQTDNNEPYSFARFLIHSLREYCKQQPDTECGILPFDLDEFICPKSVIFINISQHAKTSPRKVTEEWNIINTSIKSKKEIPMISINKLTKLTAATRQFQKMKNMTNAFGTNSPQLEKAALIPFRKSAPTTVDLAKNIKKIINKMAFVNHSMNVFKFSKPTFYKPNRRNPDDFNKQGKIIGTSYKPDIHIYIDTSGSISERNYQDAVKACIRMAIKMNVDLYFNSFSHFLSQSAKLHTKNRSPKEVYREFQKIAKVTGGTDYELVWEFIQRNKKRKEELSIMMTDFEYLAPRGHIDHPKHLYYIPVSHKNWNQMVHSAELFTKSMQGEIPNIRKHILF